MAITDNNIFNWLELVSKVPPALLQRLRPNPAETMAPRPGYEMGGMSTSPEVTMPPAREPASFIPATSVQPPAANGFEMGGFQNEALQLPFAQRRPASTRRYTPPVSSKIASPPPQAAAPAPSQSGFSLIPAAAAAEPEATPAAFPEPSAAPDAGGNGNVMARLQGYLDRLDQPRDKSGENIDNALALMIGGLNTMAAASRPGVSPFGAFAEGNAGGLNTMLALRGQRRREESDNSREALGVLGTMANLENAAATRADTKAYREATLGESVASRKQRDREFEANLGVNRDKLREDQRQADISAGLKRDALAAEAPVRQSQVAENNARAKYYDAGGRAAAGGQDPADVKVAQWLIENKVAADPTQAWDMARRAKQNPDEALTKIYTGLASDPMNMRKGPDELAAMAKQAYRGLFEAPSGGGGAGASSSGMPQGARQAKDGQWYVPDQNSKSGWSRVVTTP